MKLFVPVFGIIVGSGMCCCCSGDMTDKLSELEEQMGGEPTITEPPDINDAGEDKADGAGEKKDDAAAGSASVAATDLCSPFGPMGTPTPDGFTVLVCADNGGSASLTFKGDGDLGAACTKESGWAEGAGWTKQTYASMGGTTSYIYKKDSKNLTIACTNAAGSPMVVLSLSNGF